MHATPRDNRNGICFVMGFVTKSASVGRTQLREHTHVLNCMINGQRARRFANVLALNRRL